MVKNAMNSLIEQINFNMKKSFEYDNCAEKIDWGNYLKEGQEDFFDNYGSETESEWSEDEVDGNDEEELQCIEINEEVQIEQVEQSYKEDNLLQRLKEENASKNWLITNVQNNWWNELDWNQCEVISKFPAANFCEFWRKNIIKSSQIIGTVSEYKAIREVLWMLMNPSQMVLFHEEEKFKYVVRDNVTIPSLTVIAFKDILKPYCEYFTMIREIENFCVKLYKIHDNSNTTGLLKKEPPLTYLTYNAALLSHIFEIKKDIIEIEKSVMKQDQIHTLLTISANLKNLLYKVKIIYEVHKTITDDLFITSNENAVAKLLSGLYYHIENAINKEDMYIYTSLYLSSITVYLNIIDTWMIEGRLEDWRNEFLIFRNVDEFTFEEGFQIEKFIVKSVNSAYSTDPLIKLILEKVCQMGRNIDLLVTLERMSELWDSSDDKSGIRTSLSTEFMDQFLKELSEYRGEIIQDTTDHVEEKMEVEEMKVTSVLDDEEITRVVTRQFLQTDNVFLLTAFESFLPIASNSIVKDYVDGQSECTEAVESKNKKLKNLLEPILPIRKIIEHTLTNILDRRYSKSSKLVKDILMKEYKLEEHMKLMRCIYMMEMSHIVNKFIFQFFYQVENNLSWNNSVVLTRNLEEVLSEKWPETSCRWTVSVDKVMTNQVLEAIDKINLHYAIGWPINMLLNDTALEKYNAIFKFYLKLKWALWTLSNLRFSDFEGSRSGGVDHPWQQFYAKRLESLRFWLLHAIGSIHSYLCGQVFQCLAYVLENAISQAEDLDTIINLHNEFLDKVYEHCLQTDQFSNLRDTINNLFDMCIQIRNKWERGSKSLKSVELDILEKNYVKYHTKLAFALHHAAVNHKNVESQDVDKYDVFEKNQKFSDYLSKLSQSMFTDIACLSSSSMELKLNKKLNKKRRK